MARAHRVGHEDNHLVPALPHIGPAIAAATVLVVLVGVLTLVPGTGGSAPAAIASPPTTSTTLAPTTAGAPAGTNHRQGIKGQITAINGSTWTAGGRPGASVEVELTPTTVSTKAAPLSATSFKPGDQIVVIGTRTKATVMATRIGEAPAEVGGSATTTPTTTP